MRFIETFNLQSFGDSSISLLAAFIFGTLIGAERQYRQRSAGLRTNALVALGGAAFVDLAQRLGGDVQSLRVIAYVVSGIGFLGAGAIIREGANVRGLNTAATLWCSAAVGACTGSDMLAEAGLLTFFIIAGNTVLRSVVQIVDRLPAQSQNPEAGFMIRMSIQDGAAQAISSKLDHDLQQAGFRIDSTSFVRKDEDTIAVQIRLAPSANNSDALTTCLSPLSGHPDVILVSWDSAGDS